MKKFIILIFLTFLWAVFLTRITFAQTGLVTATVRANPLDVSISAQSPPPLGQWFNIDVTVSNQGSQTITDTVVSINNPQGLSIKGKKSVGIANLSGTSFQVVTWEAKTNTPGDYVIQIEATGTLSGETVTASDSAIISVVAPLSLRLLRLIFGV